MKYDDVEPGISTQYIDDYDLTQNIPVKARYIKSKIDGDNGNPFIEALPQPRLGKEVSHDYYGEHIHGTVIDITDKGTLLLDVSGKQIEVSSGEVTLNQMYLK